MNLSEEAMKEKVRSLLKESSFRKLAARLGISHNVIGEYVYRDMMCPPALARALGYRRDVRYVPVTTARDGAEGA